MAFEHTVREQTQTVERSESWHSEINGYDVGVERRDDGFTEVWISNFGNSLRLPLLKFYPKRVADIEHVIEVLPDLLKATVIELRAAGLDDLRSRSDVMMDEHRESMDRMMASFRSASPQSVDAVDPSVPPRES
jgi:hypothetical protein